MKALPVVVVAAALAFPAYAQSYLSPKRVTEKVRQQQQQQQQQVQQSAQPTAQPPPQPVQRVAPAQPARPPQAALPAKPVDPAKAAAEKDAARLRLIAYQKEQAEKGSPGSQFDLGMRYLNGDGVEHDDKIGREWLEKSAKQGNEDAAKKLKELDDAAKEADGKGAKK